MSNWQFNNPKLMRDGSLCVTGPTDSAPPPGLIGDVTIRLMIIQQDERNTTTKPVIIDYLTTWNPSRDGDQFTATVPQAEVKNAQVEAGRSLQVGSAIRGIAIAILVRRYDPEDPRVPPAIETFTWCVDKVLEEEQELEAS